MEHGRSIAVVGLGYVGLPVAIAAAQAGARTLGFDIDQTRVAQLRAGEDRTREIDREILTASSLRFSADPIDLRIADFFIVTVPTPIDEARRPDLGPLFAASRTVGAALKRGDIVVYESTVYPGATEEACVPVLEAVSGLTAGVDFTVGYSPERINPGDKIHRIDTITKVVSGQDAATLEIVAAVYGSFVTAGVHKASSIKVAEAAKVIENAQRDINIAFMNELSEIFHLIGIDTNEVLAAARTKWNFLPFSPGLVGGHCIGVDPYYLTHKAETLGYHPQIILAGRRLNDDAGARIARECIKLLLQNGGGETITVLGLSFKEDVPDIRNSRVVDIIAELSAHNLIVQVADPLADAGDAKREYGIDLVPFGELVPADAVILAVPHADYVSKGWPLILHCLANRGRVVIDVKASLDLATKPEQIALWRM